MYPAFHVIIKQLQDRFGFFLPIWADIPDRSLITVKEKQPEKIDGRDQYNGQYEDQTLLACSVQGTPLEATSLAGGYHSHKWHPLPDQHESVHQWNCFRQQRSTNSVNLIEICLLLQLQDIISRFAPKPPKNCSSHMICCPWTIYTYSVKHQYPSFWFEK